MKLENFLYEYLTTFMDFLPGDHLKKAVDDWVYQGITPGDDFPKSWATSRRFEEECKKGTEYFLKNGLGNGSTYFWGVLPSEI